MPTAASDTPTTADAARADFTARPAHAPAHAPAAAFAADARGPFTAASARRPGPGVRVEPPLLTTLVQPPYPSQPASSPASLPAAAPADAPAARSGADKAAAAPPPALSRSGLVLRLHARALEHDAFATAATAVVTELAQLLGCDRVSVGFCQQGRVRVAAVSHGGDIQQQQSTVLALAAAMQEALDQHNLVVHPMPRDSAPGLSLAHAELGRLNGRLPICTMPIVNQGRLLGAFVLERRAGIDLRTLDAAKDSASFIGPLLEMRHRLSQPLGGRLSDAIAAPGVRIGPWALSPKWLATGAAALVLLVAALWPTHLRVVAPARVEGAGQQVVAAPVDGFLRSVSVRPGDRVKAGQEMLTLEDRDLALERDKWAAEASQLDKLFREALTQDEAAAIVVARSKYEQAQAQLALVQRQIERARITAPMDGVVLSGDLSQAVGSPVKRGQELMTVAPEGQFRVVAEVDEQDVSQLQLDQAAQVMFGALLGERIELQLTRIAPVATALEQRNVFEVDGQPSGDVKGLRAGLRGVVRIDVEPRLQISVWWYHARQWWQRLAWRWLG